LPTPARNEPGFTFQPVDKNGVPTDNPNERWYHPETGRLVQKGIIQVVKATNLLRTPAASEAERGHQPEDKARARGGQVTLSGQFMHLPTPNTMDDLPARDESKIDRSKGGYSNVRETVVRPNFDRFEPAIRRWEAVTENPAPAPTKPDGKDGAQRLSSEFTEWMMGLQPGWITSVGLSRKDELKACGNGVVPQQAQLALKMLLERKNNE
jgi:DNA (cytosine-5)-methyltransferase 1